MRGNEVITVTRRLSDLTAGGVPLVRSLSITAAQTRDVGMRAALSGVLAEVESGRSFSDAVAARPDVFSPVYAGLVRAGESSGTLEACLEELSRHLEDDRDARRQLRVALAYPSFLLVMAAGVSAFLTVGVIPAFRGLFQEMGQRLPWPTRFLMMVANGLPHLAVPVAVTAIAGVSAMRRRPGSLARVESLLFRWGPLADLLRSAFLARWSSLLSSLLRSGYTVPDALTLTRHVARGPVFSSALAEAVRRIGEGESLAQALAAHPDVFPPLVTELVGAGEESGQLDATLGRLALTFRRESELSARILLSALEPVLLLGMGAVVGFVALAMLLPIFDMSAGIR